MAQHEQNPTSPKTESAAYRIKKQKFEAAETPTKWFKHEPSEGFTSNSSNCTLRHKHFHHHESLHIYK